MIQLEGVITAISPLHIGSGRSKGTFIQTLDHIPGRTLRGMLGYYLFKNDKQLFDSIGIDEEKDISKMGIFFKNAYPVENDEMTVASPLNLRWCKKCGALFEKDERECKGSVNNKPCLHEGKKHAGFILLKSLKEKKLKPISQPTKIETKCPITRDKHASMPADSELKPYHIQSIDSGARFGFRMLVRDEFADKIIEALRNAGTFYGVGGFRSRGYGSVRFDITGKTDMNEVLAKRTDEISKMSSKLLIVNSQMILRDGNESIIGFDETFLEYSSNVLKSIGLAGKINFVENTGKISTGIARGWSLKNNNSLSELIPCINAGSCINVSGDAQALSALEAYGIGEMINCGYGDVYVTGDIL
ncbi:MAG: hypothetical protein CVV34_00045 [Methanomicrobiales archaeon HGW-Methanomicrobiales-5]|jgi:CRISPR/Cas system CSM-associated protein Csm3 (group 7 of RAMP superfamily)|nr:MAG: hypothetical protein CVV34_00045 [Methanomicrobiales archaeon HGW-Methanomicrobiales-5]